MPAHPGSILRTSRSWSQTSSHRPRSDTNRAGQPSHHSSHRRSRGSCSHPPSRRSRWRRAVRTAARSLTSRHSITSRSHLGTTSCHRRRSRRLRRAQPSHRAKRSRSHRPARPRLPPLAARRPPLWSTRLCRYGGGVSATRRDAARSRRGCCAASRRTWRWACYNTRVSTSRRHHRDRRPRPSRAGAPRPPWCARRAVRHRTGAEPRAPGKRMRSRRSWASSRAARSIAGREGCWAARARTGRPRPRRLRVCYTDGQMTIIDKFRHRDRLIRTRFS